MSEENQSPPATPDADDPFMRVRQLHNALSLVNELRSHNCSEITEAMEQLDKTTTKQDTVWYDIKIQFDTLVDSINNIFTLDEKRCQLLQAIILRIRNNLVKMPPLHLNRIDVLIEKNFRLSSIYDIHRDTGRLITIHENMQIFQSSQSSQVLLKTLSEEDHLLFLQFQKPGIQREQVLNKILYEYYDSF
jgi:hypothetical protein